MVTTPAPKIFDPAPPSSPVPGTITGKGLREALSKTLSGNLSRVSDGESNALDRIAAALEAIASALAKGRLVSANHTPPDSPDESPTVTETVAEFLRAKARAGRSDRYLRALRVSLLSFASGRAQTPLAAVTVSVLESWLNRRHWSLRTQRGYLSDVRTMFNFAVRRGLAKSNPAAAVELPEAEQAPVAIHSPAEVRRVLEFARRYDLNLCRCLAVRYFAGLRSAEADRLRETDFRPGHVEVTAAKAKTRRRRLVTIQPALAAWLALGGTLDFGDRSNRWRWFNTALAKAESIAWPHNVTRHSFVSYHLAAFQNAGKTALEAGHTEQMTFAHYREIVTPEAAAEFWAIRPVSRSE